MPSRFLLIFFAILLDASFMLAAKFANGRFTGIAPDFRPKRRNLLTEKQIERKKQRKEDRAKARDEEKKKRQEARNNELNVTTTSTNITSDLTSNSPTTAIASARPSSSPTPSPTLMTLTTQPSSSPSGTPTTDTLSVRPSSSPSSPASTSIPSSIPSASPTTPMPSNRPSDQESNVPTSWPSEMPSNRPSAVQTTISCDEEHFDSGLSFAIIRFQYQIEFKPSVSRDDAIDHVDESVAEVVANAFLPCRQPTSDRKLDASEKDPDQTFDLLAVDSLPKDAVSTTETCTARKSSWGCVVVLGAVTTGYTNVLAKFDLNAVLGTIEKSSLEGDLNLPRGKSRITYLSSTAIATEPVQQAPILPSVASAQNQEPDPSNSWPPKYAYAIAVSAAFVGSVAFAFLVFRYRQHLSQNGALQADSEGNLQPPEHQEVGAGPSQYEATAGIVGGGVDAASYVSEDTFWRNIVGKRPRVSSSNYQRNACNARYESDASIALSSIGASFKGAMGLEDDIDIESCGSSTIDEASCLADVAASYDNHSIDDGRGKKWIDRLGILADPK